MARNRYGSSPSGINKPSEVPRTFTVAPETLLTATGTAGGNGFTAIIVAWLAKFNTFTMALISFLLIFLEKGAAEIASAYNLNDFASDIIAGVILFFILGSEFFINYKAIFRGHAGKEVC